jgi:hypothetical protein
MGIDRIVIYQLSMRLRIPRNLSSLLIYSQPIIISSILALDDTVVQIYQEPAVVAFSLFQYYMEISVQVFSNLHLVFYLTWHIRVSRHFSQPQQAFPWWHGWLCALVVVTSLWSVTIGVCLVLGRITTYGPATGPCPFVATNDAIMCSTLLPKLAEYWGNSKVYTAVVNI